MSAASTVDHGIMRRIADDIDDIEIELTSAAFAARAKSLRSTFVASAR